MALENTKTDFFTDLVTFDVESGLQEPQSIYYTRQTSKPSTKMKRPFARAAGNIQQVLANFNQKEIYIIEQHLWALTGESCYLQKR
jgi:hypothetical protein